MSNNLATISNKKGVIEMLRNDNEREAYVQKHWELEFEAGNIKKFKCKLKTGVYAVKITLPFQKVNEYIPEMENVIYQYIEKDGKAVPKWSNITLNAFVKWLKENREDPEVKTLLS
jgi:hypothetical protein